MLIRILLSLGGKPHRVPVYNMEKNIKQNRMMRLVGNAFVRITPFKDFRVELSASANYYDLDGNDYKYTSTTGSWAQGEGQNSSGGHNTERKWSTLLQALANYDHVFGNHGISVIAGFSSEQSNLGFSTAQSFNKPFPNDAITGSFDGSKVTAGTNTVTEKQPINCCLCLDVCNIIMQNVICCPVVCVMMAVPYSELTISGASFRLFPEVG